MAQEPVARIVDIKLTRGINIARKFVEGQFLPVRVNQNAVGPVESVAAVVIRNHAGVQGSVAHLNQMLFVGDIIKTGPDTVMLIEFLIGGRVGVNSSACIEIADERSVSEEVSGWANPFKGMFAMPKRPLEIQTNGGIMGIRG